MMTITNGMNRIKDFIQRDVVYAEYQSAGTWARIAISDIRVLADGRIGIYVFFGAECPNSITGIKSTALMPSSFI